MVMSIVINAIVVMINADITNVSVVNTFMYYRGKQKQENMGTS